FRLVCPVRTSRRNVATNASRRNAFFALFGQNSCFFGISSRHCTSGAAVAVEADGTVRSTCVLMIERLARLGYASIGIVYMIVGGFAVARGVGQRGSAGGQKDAFALILHQPFGRVLLTILAGGLVGYVLWRFVSAVTDSEHRGSDMKGIGIR